MKFLKPAILLGCYRPPSAVNETLSSLTQIISDINSKELVLIGNLNLKYAFKSDDLKAYCNSMNLFQIVNSPTRPNLKCPENLSLIDLIITNVPHKYSMASVFANYISDHCLVATVRNIKIPKSKPYIITKCDMKHFMEQAFLHK